MTLLGMTAALALVTASFSLGIFSTGQLGQGFWPDMFRLLYGFALIGALVAGLPLIQKAGK